MHCYSFEKLDAWKEAKDLAVYIYRLTQKFPDEEKFGMTSQLRRSARSAAANIAEGSARFSKKEQAHFYTISYGSAIEVLNDLLIAIELKYITTDELNEGRRRVEKVTFLINGLRKSLGLRE